MALCFYIISTISAVIYYRLVFSYLYSIQADNIPPKHNSGGKKIYERPKESYVNNVIV